MAVTGDGMSTQDTYMFIFMLLTLAQVYCAIRAFRSDRPIGRYTGRLNFAILVPIVANIFITKAYGEEISVAGYYLSYAGMTLILLSLVHFTSEYCKGVDPGKKHRKPVFIYVLGVLDIIQLALGPVLHHVYDRGDSVRGRGLLQRQTFDRAYDPQGYRLYHLRLHTDDLYCLRQEGGKAVP